MTAEASVLFPDPSRGSTEVEEPDYFTDLYLDQVVEAITAGRETYDLRPFFHTPLSDVETIEYRHEVLRDLQNQDVYAHVRAFAGSMRQMRKQLEQAGKLHYNQQRQAWSRDAVETYCRGVRQLSEDLGDDDLGSRGLCAVRDHVAEYVASDAFRTLVDEARRVKEGLASVRYSLTIRGSRVKVGRYEGEEDYSEEIARTFEKFRQGDVKDYRVKMSDHVDMNHVEAQVVELVARLFPDEFGALGRFCDRHRAYVDDTIAAFDREVQFYASYLEYIRRLGESGLRFCYPTVTRDSKQVCAREAFDIALANKLAGDGTPVVCNDFELTDPERVIVVSGPNQGGKTTFARMYGQLHHLASIGLLVPGTEARLYLFDRLFTHFEREEDITNLTGKLEDDLLRVHEILEQATSDSVVVMNESFTSTTLDDALLLGRAVLEQMIELDLLCVYVTFVDELSALSDTTVSMTSMVDPDDPATRTFKVVRRPADGLAYAAAIAQKYGLSYVRLKERVSA